MTHRKWLYLAMSAVAGYTAAWFFNTIGAYNRPWDDPDSAWAMMRFAPLETAAFVVLAIAAVTLLWQFRAVHQSEKLDTEVRHSYVYAVIYGLSAVAAVRGAWKMDPLWMISEGYWATAVALMLLVPFAIVAARLCLEEDTEISRLRVAGTVGTPGLLA